MLTLSYHRQRTITSSRYRHRAYVALSSNYRAIVSRHQSINLCDGELHVWPYSDLLISHS